MATPRRYRRNYKSGRNQKVTNEFISDIVGAVRVGSASAMRKIAQRGIDRLVNSVAGFSDYTKVLINSYQAAVFTKGKLDTNPNYHRGMGAFRGDFDSSGEANRSYGNVFRNRRGGIVLITSYNSRNPITFKTVKNKGKAFPITKRRNPKSKESIRNRYRRGARGPYLGYGRDMSKLRAYTPKVRLGYEVVFDNPTPYAEHVQQNNKGSRVMPVGTSSMITRGMAVSITSSEIYNTVRKAQQQKKRR